MDKRKSQEEKKVETLVILLLLPITIAVGFGRWFLFAWLFSISWRWFAEPIGAAHLSYVQAVGVVSILNFVINHCFGNVRDSLDKLLHPDKEYTGTEALRRTLNGAVTDVIGFGFLAIMHLLVG